MAVDVQKLQLVLETKGVKLSKAELKGLETQTKSTTSSFMGMAAGIAAVATAGKALSSIVSTGREFTSSMSQVRSIINDGIKPTQLLDAEMKKLATSARLLGGETVFTAGEVGSLQTEFAKLGFTVEEIENVQRGTLNLAAAVQVDLAEAASVAGGTLRMFQLDATEMGRVTDVMAASFNKSALDMEKFTNSMTYVGPIAKNTGISLESTTAVLGTLANNMIDGSIAGTAVRQIFLQMGNESSKLAKKLGYAVKSDEDLTRALKDLRDMGLSTAEMEDLVGKRAIAAFSIMLDQVPKVEELDGALRKVAGTTQRMADDQLNNLEGDLKILSSATAELSLKFYDSLEPALRLSAQALTSFIQGIDEEEIKAYGVGVGLAGTAMLTYSIYTNRAIFATKGFTAALTKTGWGAVIVGAGLAAGAILDYFNVFEEHEENVDDTIDSIKELKKETEELLGITANGTKDAAEEERSYQEILKERIEDYKKQVDLYKHQQTFENESINSLIEAANAAKKKYDLDKDGVLTFKELRDNVKELEKGEKASLKARADNSKLNREILELEKEKKRLSNWPAKQQEFLAEIAAREVTIGQNNDIIEQNKNVQKEMNNINFLLREFESYDLDFIDTESLGDAKSDFSDVIKRYEEDIAAAEKELAGLEESNENTTEAVKKLKDLYEEFAKAQALQNEKTANETLFKAHLMNSNIELTETMRNQILTYIEQGLSIDEIMEKIGAQVEAVQTLEEKYKAFTDAQTENTKQRVENDLFAMQSIGDLTNVTQENIDDVVANMTTKGQTFKEAVKDVFGLEELPETVRTKTQEAKDFLNDFTAEYLVSGEDRILAEYDSQKKLLEAAGAGNEAFIELERQKNEAISELEQERIEKTFANMQQVMDAMSDVFSEYKTMVKAEQKQEVAELKASSKYRNANSKEQKRLMKELKDKHYEEERKMFNVSQYAKAADVIMSTAKGIGIAMTMVPPNPVLAGIIGASGAVQLGLIHATPPPPPPAETGGYLRGNSHAAGGVIIEAEGGEYVIRKSAVEKYGKEIFDMYNQELINEPPKKSLGGFLAAQNFYGRGGTRDRLNALEANNGGAINITFQGNVLSDDFIIEEAIPKIRSAIQRGEDIGV